MNFHWISENLTDLNLERENDDRFGYNMLSEIKTNSK